jgi:hypothetical protein
MKARARGRKEGRPMLYETKENKSGPVRRSSGFVMVVSKRCTLKPGKRDAWHVGSTPLLLVGLFGEAADTVEVERLETLAFA